MVQVKLPFVVTIHPKSSTSLLLTATSGATSEYLATHTLPKSLATVVAVRSQPASLYVCTKCYTEDSATMVHSPVVDE